MYTAASLNARLPALVFPRVAGYAISVHYIVVIFPSALINEWGLSIFPASDVNLCWSSVFIYYRSFYSKVSGGVLIWLLGSCGIRPIGGDSSVK